MRRRSGLAVLWLSAISSHAFVSYVNDSGNVLRWSLAAPNAAVHTNVVNRKTKAVRYSLAADAYSAANRAAELNAMRACFAQWQSVPGTSLKFEEGGFIGPGADINTSDNTNAVFWAKSSTLVNGGMDDIHGLAGLTVLRFSNDNTIFEADIVLNGVEFGWLTDLDDKVSAQPFIEATLLHEIGHFIGLDHSPIGGATVTHGDLGFTTELCLSSDEISAARFLYPVATVLPSLATIQGRIVMNGTPVFGAMVIAENSTGNVAAGTISRVSGSYEIPALPPGNYQIRVVPLDPSAADETASLMRGQDIAGDYESAMTSFLPTTNRTVTLQPGVSSRLDFTVTTGSPPFRITGISRPTDILDAPTRERAAVFIYPGQSNLFIGVSSLTLPIDSATLSVTGDGVTLGPPIFKPNRFIDGSNLIMASIDVASNATPGLRTLIVQQGSNFAYANGYLEIMPLFPDFNFDGLDDTFQRKYFAPFTAPEAAPGADPDGDGYDNLAEFRMGSDPTNPLSFVFRIQSALHSATGTLIRWESVVGKRYQVVRRPDLSTSSWQLVGAPIIARESMTQYLDPPATNKSFFYRVQALP